PRGAIKVGPMVFMPLGENPGRIVRLLGYALFPLRLILRAVFVGIVLYALKGLL
ncbi:MAG: hypothetical protein GTN89_03110, partial [Acidobacteria bacterium]|nr:hypothetical protein [Acidobacteriota bacterium]